MKTNKALYTSSDTDHDPAYIIAFGIQDYGIRYERKAYGLVDFFGQLGGIFKVLNVTFALLVGFLCNNMIEAKKVNIFF